MSLKKRRILETATGLFSEEGYSSVGINRIIAESKVAKMTLYKYFPSKEFLIESVLIKHDHELRASINSALDKHESAASKLKAIFDWHKDWFATPAFHGCMFIKASQEFPHDRLKVKEIAQMHKTWLESVISNCLRALNVKKHTEMAGCILAILDGLTVRLNMLKKDSREMVAAAWLYVESIIRIESE